MEGSMRPTDPPVDARCEQKPQRHPEFYIPEGDIVFQVEKTLFRVHRYFLTKHSVVLRDMLEIPQGDTRREGTDQNPIVLPDDNAQAWSHLLACLYRSDPVGAMSYTGDQCVEVARLAHKYLMESIEEGVIALLRAQKSTHSYISMILISQITHSDRLYKEALRELRKEGQPWPTREHAKRVGSDIYRDIITPNFL
ncbi:hypothetical protein CPB86DRAFT_499836 [Serendipita vermifera]|nr:hypothetical protein CPB86DRAFT_499836 [Serendipita vermifera]